MRANCGVGDCFVFLASPLPDGRYGLRFYPELPEIASEVEVSKGRLGVFLLQHQSDLAVEHLAGTEDLFVSLMTADEVRELAGDKAKSRRCASRLRSRRRATP